MPDESAHNQAVKNWGFSLLGDVLGLEGGYFAYASFAEAGFLGSLTLDLTLIAAGLLGGGLAAAAIIPTAIMLGIAIATSNENQSRQLAEAAGPMGIVTSPGTQALIATAAVIDAGATIATGAPLFFGSDTDLKDPFVRFELAGTVFDFGMGLGGVLSGAAEKSGLQLIAEGSQAAAAFAATIPGSIDAYQDNFGSSSSSSGPPPGVLSPTGPGAGAPYTGPRGSGAAGGADFYPFSPLCPRRA